MKRPIFTILASIVLVSSASAREIVVTRTSDCRSINTAIQALPSEGGTVQIEAATFICEEPVVIDRDNVTLRGAGRGQTILRLKPMNAAPLLVIGVMQVEARQTERHGIQYYPVREVQNIEVADLSLDGDLPNQKPAFDHECYDVENKKSLSCAGDGGRFIRNNGVTVRRARNVRLFNIAADRELSGGLVLEKLSSHILVDGFYAEGNAFDGIAGYETRHSIFKNVLLQKNKFSGISVDFDFEDNIFDHVALVENGDNGIFSHSVSRNTYKNLIARNNGNYGAWIDGIRRNKGKDAEGNDVWEIVPATCDETHFINAKFVNNRNPAIRINHVCQGVKIENVKVKKRDLAQECVSTHEGSSVEYSGPFVCE